MSDQLATYLNDHLAGATFGRDHAYKLADETAGTPLGDTMSSLASDIDADRDELIALMDRLDIDRSAIKQATTWIAEKLGRPKFSGATSGDQELGRFLALEAMSLGVEGKLCLWEALRNLVDTRPGLDADQLRRLSDRARSQRETLERERGTMAAHALSGDRAGAAATGHATGG
jgi:hypothetical protein